VLNTLQTQKNMPDHFKTQISDWMSEIYRPSRKKYNDKKDKKISKILQNINSISNEGVFLENQ